MRSKVAVQTVSVIALMLFSVLAMAGTVGIVIEVNPVPEPDPIIPVPVEVEIVAGHNIDIGSTIIANDEENLYITIDLDEAQNVLMEQFQAGDKPTWQDFDLTKKGNIKVGHLEYKEEFDPPVSEYMFEIPLDEGVGPGDTVCIALHLDVVFTETGEEEGAWAGYNTGLQFPGKNWASYFEYTVQEMYIPEKFDNTFVVSDHVGDPVEGVYVLLYDVTGTTLYYYGITDALGEVAMGVYDGDYQVIVWGPGGVQYDQVVTVPDDDTVTPLTYSMFTISVENTAGDGIEGAAVTVYGSDGTTRVAGGYTSSDGTARIGLPGGDYVAVASKDPGLESEPVAFTVGGPAPVMEAVVTLTDLTVHVQDTAGVGVANASVYMYADGVNGTVPGSGATGDDGTLVVYLPDGDYQVMAYKLPGVPTDLIDFSVGASNPSMQVIVPYSNFTVFVHDGIGAGIPDASVKIFDEAGTTQLLSDFTDTQGKAYFFLPDGDFQAQVFKTGGTISYVDFTVGPSNPGMILSVTYSSVTTLSVMDTSGMEVPFMDVEVYDYNGANLVASLCTYSDGTATFDLPQGDYLVRVKNMWYPWTPLYPLSVGPGGDGAPITVPYTWFTVELEDCAGQAMRYVELDVYDSTGRFLIFDGDTRSAGSISLYLPDGTYMARASMDGGLAAAYLFTVGPSNPGMSTVLIYTGYTLSVQDQDGIPLDARVSLYDTEGRDLGLSTGTGPLGGAVFGLPDGTYQAKVRVMGAPGADGWYTFTVGGGSPSTETVLTMTDYEVAVVDSEGAPVRGAVVSVFGPGGDNLAMAPADGSGTCGLWLADGEYLLWVYGAEGQTWQTVVVGGGNDDRTTVVL